MRRIVLCLLLTLALSLPALAQSETQAAAPLLAQSERQAAAPALSVMDLLDRTDAFSFAIMSDHKGSAPSNSPEMARMAEWMRQSRTRFVIGLGDHLCKRFDNPFLDFVNEDEWWHRHFYPNIADGESGYYGAGQGDWGSGGKLLQHINIAERPGVFVRENGCEYYARIHAAGFTVHLIQLHYSDNPKDPAIAFNEDSRQYLIDTLQSINKGLEDIIIVGAHSRSGYWVHQLSPERQKIVMDKCDGGLSATTHRYGRQVPVGYETSGALCINTGSVNYPAQGPGGGYIQVSVFRSAKERTSHAMVLQYVSVERDVRTVALPQNKAYLKEIGGGVHELDLWPKLPPAPEQEETAG